MLVKGICVGGALLWILGYVPGTIPAPASPRTYAVHHTDSAAVGKGARAVRAGRYNEAIRHLAPVTDHTIPRHPTYGSAATWLGRAFQERGNIDRARDIWLLALRQDRRPENRPPPAGAADLFLRSFSPGGLQERAGDVTEVYHRLLQAMVADSVSATADTVLRRRAARLSIIVPDSISVRPAHAFGEHSASHQADTLGGTPQVSRWLQAQDPILATTPNERIAEHLTRVREADQRYAWAGRPSGLDDRGHIYVRYGPPDRTTTVSYEAGAKSSVMLANGQKIPTLAEVDRASPDLNRESFPVDNEVWIYTRYGVSGHFIFTKRSKKGGAYLSGTARDLFPFELQRPGRILSALTGLSEWEIYLSVYSAVYEQLATVDERYLSRYTQLYSYDPDRLSAPPPLTHVRTELDRNERQNRQMQREREREMPRQQSDVLGDRPSMPVAIRTVRFLTEEGTTRTEVYWGVRMEALLPSDDWLHDIEAADYEPSGRYSIRVAGALRTSGLRTQMRRARTHTLPDVQNSERVSRALVLEGSAPRQWVALEWVQNSIGRDGDKGPAVHVTRVRTESRPALSADPSQLEMSDLRLLAGASAESKPPDDVSDARRRSIPFDTVKTGGPIALNFDVYHLKVGPDDRTHYTVEYSAEYEKDRGGLAGLFGGTETETTSATSTYRGANRRTSEYIVLDLGARSDLSEPTPITVRVRVTDEVSGQSVSRPVTFTLVPSSDSL